MLHFSAHILHQLFSRCLAPGEVSKRGLSPPGSQPGASQTQPRGFPESLGRPKVLKHLSRTGTQQNRLIDNLESVKGNVYRLVSVSAQPIG